MKKVGLNPDLFIQRACLKCGTMILFTALGNNDTKCPFCKAVHKIKVNIEIRLKSKARKQKGS